MAGFPRADVTVVDNRWTFGGRFFGSAGGCYFFWKLTVMGKEILKGGGLWVVQNIMTLNQTHDGN